MNWHPVVSLSGGKDSTATLLLALDRSPDVLFADTGNEHPATVEYATQYLPDRLGVTVQTIRQDFTGWWWRCRTYVAEKWEGKGVPTDVIDRALEVYDAGPTGNPFLDLCIIKHRFPSRRMQFCTEWLKTRPLTERLLEIQDEHEFVESWQGVRADESHNRRNAARWEYCGAGVAINRPIVWWSAEQVFDLHRARGVEPNPLYKQGATRVGCMPCINENKDSLLNISKRWPEHIDRIAQWERIVGEVSKRQNATFLPAEGDNATAYERGNIRAQVEWSKTRHGGRLMDWVRIHDDVPQCASSYGLCE